jgi:hypothetical protein
VQNFPAKGGSFALAKWIGFETEAGPPYMQEALAWYHHVGRKPDEALADALSAELT